VYNLQFVPNNISELATDSNLTWSKCMTKARINSKI